MGGGDPAGAKSRWQFGDQATAEVVMANGQVGETSHLASMVEVEIDEEEEGGARRLRQLQASMAEWNDIIATTQALLLVVIESGENEAACGRDARAEVAEAWAEELLKDARDGLALEDVEAKHEEEIATHLEGAREVWSQEESMRARAWDDWAMYDAMYGTSPTVPTMNESLRLNIETGNFEGQPGVTKHWRAPLAYPTVSPVQVTLSIAEDLEQDPEEVETVRVREPSVGSQDCGRTSHARPAAPPALFPALQEPRGTVELATPDAPAPQHGGVRDLDFDELVTIWKDWRCGLYTNELTNDFIVQRWGPMALDVLQIQEVAHTGQVDTQPHDDGWRRRGAAARDPEEFLQLRAQIVLRFGQLRGERAATHLPYQAPFNNIQLLGTDYALRDTLAGYLGEECELESAMIITVDPGAPAQNAHVDTQDEGSVSVHIPLHSLHDGFAPLGFCMGSHTDPSVLSAPPRLKLRGAERRQKAEKALHRQTRATAKEEHFLQWGPSEVALLPAVDFRRGAMRVLVRNFRDDAAKALGLQQGDEVTHVNDLDFVSWLEVKDHVPELRDNIVARVLRPVTEPNAAEDLKEELPALSAASANSSPSQAPSRLRAWFNTKRHADRMLVGAPLNIGDALIYDSRTVHWGMANCESYPRYVLYLNLKRGDFQGCSPDAIAKRSASARCLQERGRFQDRFKRALHYMA
ncbi:unnamed protein product [Symbiodinium microadriaticum]|nr:unnamed protein product [Symbiodinium microadriaticum]